MDRRGSVDSGLAQVIRVGGPSVVSTGRGGPYDDQLHRASQTPGPQVLLDKAKFHYAS